MSDLDVIDGVLLGHEIVDQGHGAVFALLVVYEPNSLFLHGGNDIGYGIIGSLVCKWVGLRERLDET